MFFDKETEMEVTDIIDEKKLADMEKYIKDSEATSYFIPFCIEEMFQKALVSPDYLPRVQQILENMATHPDATMRGLVVKKLPRLALLCLVVEMPHYVTSRLCPILLSCLNDKNEEVRKACEISLIVLIRGTLLEVETIDEKVCQWVVEVVKTDGYASTVSLMGKLAPLIGKEATEKHFLDVFIDLCSNGSGLIRRNCVKNLGDFAVVLGTEITEKRLLNEFVKFCRDKNWKIRVCCPEVFIPVSYTCSLTARKSILADAFADLLKDPRHNIRMLAYGYLGAFICTFAEPSVTKLDYDEKGDLIFIGQDGYEFRMGTLHSNYSRDSSISEESKEEKSFGNEGKGDQGLLGSNARRFFDHDREQMILASLMSSEAFMESTDQPSSGVSWSSNETNTWWNKSWTSVEDQEADDMYNAFRFWRTPPYELDVIESEPEQDDIRTNLKMLDSELSYLSEKLAECSAEDLEEIKTESLISCASSSDSGWNSAETTPHVESVPSSNPKASDSEVQSPINEDNSEVSPPCPSEVVPRVLLDSFLSMTSPVQEEICDKELAQDCAYCLPAVALTLGPSNWPYIKNAYKDLSMNIQWRVRKTVASGIHKLALLVGEEIASKDLAPIFECFVRDLDEVKIGALEHLADFLKLVRPSTRNAFLPRLKDFLETEFDFNWRYREEFGEQLRLLIKLYGPSEWLEYFKPLAILLLCDKVAAVRQKAVLLFLELIVNLAGEFECREQLLQVLLNEFAKNSSWRRRQIFVHVCSEIARGKALDPEDFGRVLLDHLLALSADSVPNVGLCVARCLASDIVSTGYIDSSSLHIKAILDTLEKLKCDVDPDIRYFAYQSEKQDEVVEETKEVTNEVKVVVEEVKKEEDEEEGKATTAKVTAEITSTSTTPKPVITTATTVTTAKPGKKKKKKNEKEKWRQNEDEKEKEETKEEREQRHVVAEKS